MPRVESNTEFGSFGYRNNVRKFGRGPSLGTGEYIVWDGGILPYDGWLDAEEEVYAVSTDPEDAVGGTGCQYLQFTGQGDEGIEKTYSLTLNGITPVLLSLTDLNVKFSTIYTATSMNIEGTNKSPLESGGAANAGVITIKSVTTDKTMALIRIGLGRTQMMIWRCGLNQYADFEKISIYPTSGKPMVAKLMARDNINVSWICVGQIDVENSIASITHPFPDFVSRGTDLCLVVKPEQTGTNVSAQMWMEKKDIPNYEAIKDTL